MKSAEIKDMSVQDLQERIDAEKAQLSQLKVQHAVSPIENPSIIKKSRREVGITDNIAVIAAAIDFGIFAGQQGQVSRIRSATVLAAKDLYGIGHGHTGTHLYLIAVCIKTDILSKGQRNILKRDMVTQMHVAAKTSKVQRTAGNGNGLIME